MSLEKKDSASSHSSSAKDVESHKVVAADQRSHLSDEETLASMGYKQEFAREFGNLSTISFAFSIMGLASSLPSTFDTPLASGGPPSVVWCWLIGSCMCFTLGTSIAELVSAYPTSGGLYSASAFLTPKKYRAIVGYVIGWLNLLGQVAGVASTEFGLSRLIWSCYALSKPAEEAWAPTNAQIVGLFIGLLCIHGALNSIGTKTLAFATQFFVFINMGAALAMIIALAAANQNKQTARFIFVDVVNNSGWGNDGIAFLLGLLSVQWTMTDYDATAHISEEVKRAAIAAPVAIFVAVIGTGVMGFVLNIILVMSIPSLDFIAAQTAGNSVASILDYQLGFGGFVAIWVFVCLTAFFVVQTALQANARTFYAFSRDGGLPDAGLFGKLASNKVPIYAVWLVVAISVAMGCLQFASATAVNAIFSLCTIALDSSYAIPIALKLIFRDHPDVQYKPGPFNLGRGILGYGFNICAVCWTSFVIIILALPQEMPVTADNMNYASALLVGVSGLALAWYWTPVIGARKYYTGPRNFTGGAFNGPQSEVVETNHHLDNKVEGAPMVDAPPKEQL